MMARKHSLSPVVSPALGKVMEEDESWSTPSSIHSSPTRAHRVAAEGDGFDKRL